MLSMHWGLQPFTLGGDGVQAAALNASKQLQEAIFSGLSACNSHHRHQPRGLEEAHISALLADLGPEFCSRHYHFLVSTLFMNILS